MNIGDFSPIKVERRGPECVRIEDSTAIPTRFPHALHMETLEVAATRLGPHLPSPPPTALARRDQTTPPLMRLIIAQRWKPAQTKEVAILVQCPIPGAPLRLTAFFKMNTIGMQAKHISAI